MSTQQMAPFFFAMFAMGLVYIIQGMTRRPGQKLQDRLKHLSQRETEDPMMTSSAGLAGSEKFQKILEDAAPQLAEKLVPTTAKHQSDLKLKLAHAGFRGENIVAKYLLLQVSCLAVGLVVGVPFFLFRYGMTLDCLIYSVLFAGFFYYLPALIVWYRTRTRQEQIFLGLPDALDLLVVCVEAGLGLDQGMRKVCEEMAHSRPIITEEFSICNFQLQMGRPRRDVLHDLGQRTGVDDMKSLAAILIQADRFGASIGHALRVQSDAMRVRRKQLAEERAAKTAVQLIFPLVLFIFPAIFVVLVGPAAIRIMETMQQM